MLIATLCSIYSMDDLRYPIHRDPFGHSCVLRNLPPFTSPIERSIISVTLAVEVHYHS